MRKKSGIKVSFTMSTVNYSAEDNVFEVDCLVLKLYLSSFK